MKFTVPFCTLAVLLAAPAIAEAADAPAASLCIRERDIRDSKTPDDRTLVFRLNNGKTYVNTLISNCPGLSFYGFAYDGSPNGELCGNLTTIRVLRQGSACLLGPFSLQPETPPPAPAQ